MCCLFIDLRWITLPKDALSAEAVKRWELRTKSFVFSKDFLEIPDWELALSVYDAAKRPIPKESDQAGYSLPPFSLDDISNTRWHLYNLFVNSTGKGIANVDELDKCAGQVRFSPFHLPCKLTLCISHARALTESPCSVCLVYPIN
jgi:hypothetical protein